MKKIVLILDRFSLTLHRFFTPFKKNRIVLIVFLFLLCANSYSGVIINNGLTHYHKGAKGMTIRGSISVQNIGNKQERIILYKENLLKLCNSIDTKPLLGNHQRSSFSWIHLGVLEKVLEINEKFTIIYDIQIPDDEALYGSYWNLLIVEITDLIVKEEALQAGISISSKIRYAIQVITNIDKESNATTEEESITEINNELNTEAQNEDTEEENAVINYENIQLIKNKEVYNIETKLHNSSSFLINASLIIDLFDEVGNNVTKIELNSKKIYPDSCTDFNIPLPADLKPGNYDAIVVADYGEELYGINISLKIDD